MNFLYDGIVALYDYIQGNDVVAASRDICDSVQHPECLDVGTLCTESNIDLPQCNGISPGKLVMGPDGVFSEVDYSILQLRTFLYASLQTYKNQIVFYPSNIPGLRDAIYNRTIPLKNPCEE